MPWAVTGHVVGGRRKAFFPPHEPISIYAFQFAFAGIDERHITAIFGAEFISNIPAMD